MSILVFSTIWNDLNFLYYHGRRKVDQSEPKKVKPSSISIGRNYSVEDISSQNGIFMISSKINNNGIHFIKIFFLTYDPERKWTITSKYEVLITYVKRLIKIYWILSFTWTLLMILIYSSLLFSYSFTPATIYYLLTFYCICSAYTIIISLN